MRHITLILAAALLAACNEIPSSPDDTDPAISPAFIEVEPSYSPGCFELTNNVTRNWDGYYAEALTGPLEFYVGEVVSISAGLPAEPGAETVAALYNDGSWSEIENGKPFPATHNLTIRTAGSITL